MGKFKPLNQNGLEPFRAGFWVERGVGFTPKRGFSVSWADDEQHGRRRRRRFARSRWGRRCEFQAWSKNLHWKIKKKGLNSPKLCFAQVISPGGSHFSPLSAVLGRDFGVCVSKLSSPRALGTWSSSKSRFGHSSSLLAGVGVVVVEEKAFSAPKSRFFFSFPGLTRQWWWK